jgi:subtilase family serine protease
MLLRTGRVSPLLVRRACLLRVEQLEPRTVPASLAPAQVRTAYGFDQITTADGSLPGTRQTIAIVAAYDHPTIAADLATFGARFGLPDTPSFTKVSQTGSTTELPAADAGWSAEISLDVQWAHAIAPGADILLVEADSPTLPDLLAAVDFARSQPGVSVVSMSWGGPEFAGQQYLDSVFTTPEGHAGVTFVAASGDAGAGPSWPAVSPNVLAVGGTTLAVTPTGDYAAEAAWGGSGGGVSRYVPRPDYQSSATSSAARTTPDVAYDANPRTGFPVYDSQNGGWLTVGGTSAGAPQWAALVAIANQGRALAGKAPLDGPTETLPALYDAAVASHSTFFHDVTGGSNGYAAGAGYDLSTGLGSPVANNLVSALVAFSGSGSVGQTVAVASPAPTPATGAKATRPVSPAPPVVVTAPVLTAFAAPAANPVLAPVNGPSAAPVLSPALPASVEPLAGPSAAAVPSALSITPSNYTIPMTASASGLSGPNDGIDPSGFWQWLFGPAAADNTPDDAAESTEGDGVDADAAVSGVAVGE